METGEPEAPLMDDGEIKRCHDSGYIEIGSHGLNHRHLSQLENEALQQEVIASKNILEHLIGDEIVSFAYPYGDYSDRDVEAVHLAGYQFGIGTVNDPSRIGQDLKRIRRILVFPNISRFSFWKKTSEFYLRYCKFKGKDF